MKYNTYVYVEHFRDYFNKFVFLPRPIILEYLVFAFLVF